MESGADILHASNELSIYNTMQHVPEPRSTESLPHLRYPAPITDELKEVVVVIVVQEKATTSSQKVDMGTEFGNLEATEVGREVAAHDDPVGRND